MSGNIHHQECQVAQTGIAFLVRYPGILAVIIEQLQAGTTRDGEVGNIKITAVDRLLLGETHHAAVEIKRFLPVDDIDGKVLNSLNIQGQAPT
jgi:hypothetical protein